MSVTINHNLVLWVQTSKYHNLMLCLIAILNNFSLRSCKLVDYNIGNDNSCNTKSCVAQRHISIPQTYLNTRLFPTIWQMNGQWWHIRKVFKERHNWELMYVSCIHDTFVLNNPKTRQEYIIMIIFRHTPNACAIFVLIPSYYV